MTLYQGHAWTHEKIPLTATYVVIPGGCKRSLHVKDQRRSNAGRWISRCRQVSRCRGVLAMLIEILQEMFHILAKKDFAAPTPTDSSLPYRHWLMERQGFWNCISSEAQIKGNDFPS